MKLILLLCSLIVGCTMLMAPASAQPGGGKTAETTPKPPAKTTTNTTTKPATTSPKVNTTPKTGTARGQAASIEGKWCLAGSRERIRTVTHNARGEILSVTEDGTRNDGRLDGPWLYLDSGDGMTIKGEMDFRANRMNWASGSYWSWCGRN